MADIEAAKGYVKEALDALESPVDLDKAQSKIELAESELDGEKPEAKAPVLKSIEEVKQKIAAQKRAFDVPKYKRMLERVMTDAEEAIGNLATWPGAENRANELFADKDAAAVLGDQLAAAKKKFATFKKLNAKKSAVQIAEQLQSSLTQLEDEWKESKATFADENSSPNSRDYAAQKLERSFADIRKRLEQLPDDSDARKQMTARVDAMQAEFTKVALAGRVKEVLEQLKRNETLYDNETEGWEKETAGPTWDQYQHQQSEKISSFNAPATKALISRFSDLLAHLDENEDYRSVADAPELKAEVARIQKIHDHAYGKMLSFVKPVYEAARAQKITNETNNWERLRDSIRLALGEKSPEGVMYQAVLQKKISDFEAATAGAEEARVKMIADLREKAAKVWPEVSEGLTGESDVDITSAKSGTIIKFTSDNLMGWRFKPGTYYFATTLAGNPVAAKIDPTVRKGIKDIEDKMGRALGDDDADGKWEIYAVVTGRKAKLEAKKTVEGSGTVGGADVKFTGEYSEPVDAYIIEIIAAKCGPFAGSKEKGILKPDGSLEH